jgi:hypothetical protein
LIVVKLKNNNWNKQNKDDKFESINQYHTMKKLLAFIILGLVISFSAYSQRKKPNLDNQKTDEQKAANEAYGQDDSWKDKVFFGGNLGGGFGNGGSFFLIQPIVGYKFTDKIQAGICPMYLHSSRTFELSNGSKKELSVNAYGPGVFGRYFINENFFAHTEYLGIKHTYLNDFDGTEVSKFSNCFYVGGGYTPSDGGIFAVFLYDLLFDAKTSFYIEPYVIRVGFMF